MRAKRWIALSIAIGLFIVSIGFRFATSVASTDWESMFDLSEEVAGTNEKVVEEGSPTNKIAVLQVNGVIQEGSSSSLLATTSYHHRRFLEQLEKAGEDRRVNGIILNVNTPGGGVVESAEIHDKIVEIKEDYDKPVYISMGNTAASGGYYISAPADKIVAHKATLTGSIGVIMESYNFAELADKIGVDFNTIKSGEYKDIMSSYRDMTEDERAILQGMVDDMYDDFVQVIVDGRDLSEKRVRELGDGRVYTGEQAQAVGLVDALGSLDDTITMMKEEQDLANAQVVEYGQRDGLEQFLAGAVQNLTSPEAKLTGIKEMLRQNNGPRAMYLYSK
ncbi:signal peptide peptidase SppA [Paraliobacillus ryukyuensis]|uniref:signal peptide peptidase SppA n=1 Tax=Paraliobacillus ryukyuensis TaxID=200904 RepID=UPI0009A5A2AD|nr:signal peptide peptidase SppA [Paraliobacillus ryukyuensis]